MDSFHLYVNLLSSSPRQCWEDLVAFVLKHLDYYLKKTVREKLQRGTVQNLEDALFGPYKQRPFQKSDGSSLQYMTLLLFVDDMMQEGVLDYGAAQRMPIYDNLLADSENALVQCLRKSAASYTPEEEHTLLTNMREEFLSFFPGWMKQQLHIPSHIFCHLLRVHDPEPLVDQDDFDDFMEAFNGCEPLPLVDQDLSSEFPPIRKEAFNESRPIVLENLALKVLALKDLESRFRANRIGKYAREVTKVALHLIPFYFEQNVSISRKVICGPMEAVIPGRAKGRELDPVVVDPPPTWDTL